MKANFIIGKRQIILGSLIVILSGAIYVNYLYSNNGEENGYGITQTLNEQSGVTDATDTNGTKSDATKEASVEKTDKTDSDSSGSSKDEDKTTTYGETQLVNNTVEDGTYFAEAELNKLKSRDEAVDTVNAILEKIDITDEEKATATAQIVEISQQIEDEGTIENLIKAKGFEECLVYIDTSSASVVVKSDGLEAEQAAQIKNIVLSQKELKPENISIVEVSE